MRRLFRQLFTSRTPQARRPHQTKHRLLPTLRRQPRLVSLEDRAVPTATLVSAPNVTATGGTTYSFQVNYADADGIDTTTIGASDVLVTGGNGSPITINAPSIAGPAASVTVTYTFNVPGGAWSLANRGAYTIDLNGGEVADLLANFEPGATLGSFLSAYRDGDGKIAVSDATDTFTADIDDGNYATGKVTLREAVRLANAIDGADTVHFTGLPNVTIPLSGTEIKATGKPVVGSTPNSLTITGPDATNPGKVVIDGGGLSRVLNLDNTGGNASVAFVLSNLTVQNGFSASDGANVLVGPNDASTLGVSATFDHVRILNGTTSTQGGGIGVGYNPGTIAVVNSTVSGNSALTGGGVYLAARGNLVVTNSTVNSNVASGGFGGGGIYFWGDSASTVTLTNTTVSGNVTDFVGGGVAIYNFTTGVATISNSTLTGNTAFAGGALYMDAAFAGTLIVQSTILGGNTVTPPGSYYYGSDIYNAGTGTVTISRSFLSKWDEGTFSATGIDANTKAISGTKATPLNPAIDALANNGGGTDTHLPKTTPGVGEVSVLNVGFNPLGLSTDQRGLARSFGTTDIGSVELITPGAPTATAILTNISKSGGNTYQFQIKYTDDISMKAGSIGAGDIRVTGPGGFNQLASFVSAVPGNTSPGDDSITITATYQITANTTGSTNWDYLDNGTYDVLVEPNAVTDTSSNAVPDGSVGAFTVNAPRPAAKASATQATLGAGSHTFTVTYTGVDTQISFASLGADDIRVTGPGGFDQPASLVGTTPGADSVTIVATYQIAAPGGAFAISNRGLYNIEVQAGKVLDADGSDVASGSLGGFTYGMVVDEVSDDDNGDIAPGKLSLREAINITNGTTAAETITFDSVTFGAAQTITLNTSTTIQLTITDSVTVTGPGVGKLTINANNGVDNNRRHFFIAPAAASTVTLSDMTLINAGPVTGTVGVNSLGGAIFASNTNLTVNNMAFTGNTAGYGGAIIARTGSVLNVTNSTFTNNASNWTVTTPGGYINGGGAIAIIDNGVPLTITNSTFTGNNIDNVTASSTGGGGAVNYIGNTSVTITGSTFSANTADGIAGAVYIRTAGDVVVNNTSFSQNTSVGNYGGAVVIDSGTTTSIRNITNSTFSQNSAGSVAGGLLFLNDGQFTVSKTLFSGNKVGTTTATAGAAMVSSLTTAGSNLLIDSSLFTNNSTASTGGAIGWGTFGATAGTHTIRNSTFSGNTSSSGALRMNGSFTGTMNIQNSTFAGNVATGAAGSVGAISRAAGTVNLSSTIVADSKDGVGADTIDMAGTFANVGFSLVENKGTALFTVSNQVITGVDPMLNALANNGGALQTMSLKAGSPAIDKGISNGNLLAANNVTRPQDDLGITNATGGDGSDIGAYEVKVSLPPPPTATSVKIDSGTGQRSMIQSITVTFSEAVNLGANPFTVTRLGTSSIPTPNGVVVLSIAGSGSTYTITFNDPTFAPAVGSAKSLIDGLYTVVLNASDITSQANGQQLDGNGDLTAGDNQTVNFHRLYGDVRGASTVDLNGNGFTDNVDLIAFRNANGSDSTQINYDPALDVNGDGFIDNIDLIAFRARLGVTP